MHSFAEFWPFYLREHSRPLTRRLHVLGTTLGVVLLAAAPFGGGGLVLAALAAGYGFAWVAHFAVEHNRPATFRHPLWSLAGDLKMTALFLSGRLEDELRRQQIRLT